MGPIRHPRDRGRHHRRRRLPPLSLQAKSQRHPLGHALPGCLPCGRVPGGGHVLSQLTRKYVWLHPAFQQSVHCLVPGHSLIFRHGGTRLLPARGFRLRSCVQRHAHNIGKRVLTNPGTGAHASHSPAGDAEPQPNCGQQMGRGGTVCGTHGGDVLLLCPEAETKLLRLPGRVVRQSFGCAPSDINPGGVCDGGGLRRLGLRHVGHAAVALGRDIVHPMVRLRLLLHPENHHRLPRHAGTGSPPAEICQEQREPGGEPVDDGSGDFAHIDMCGPVLLPTSPSPRPTPTPS